MKPASVWTHVSPARSFQDFGPRGPWLHLPKLETLAVGVVAGRALLIVELLALSGIQLILRQNVLLDNRILVHVGRRLAHWLPIRYPGDVRRNHQQFLAI